MHRRKPRTLGGNGWPSGQHMGAAVRLRKVVTLAPLRPAIHVTLLTSSGSPLVAARPRAASRSCRAAAPALALSAACLTLAWTEKTSIRRVRGGRPHHLLMRRCEEQAAPRQAGRATGREPRRAMPLESMNSMPARSAMIARWRPAAAAALAASATSSSPATRRQPVRRVPWYADPCPPWERPSCSSSKARARPTG
jgi:hypothetical protein